MLHVKARHGGLPDEFYLPAFHINKNSHRLGLSDKSDLCTPEQGQSRRARDIDIDIGIGSKSACLLHVRHLN